MKTRLLTHWGRVTQIYVSKIITVGPDNGLAPTIWTDAEILLIGHMEINFSEISIVIKTFSLNENTVCKMESISSRPQWVNCMFFQFPLIMWDYRIIWPGSRLCHVLEKVTVSECPTIEVKQGTNTRGKTEHIEAETKWPPFSRRYFQMHVLEWECMNFDWGFSEIFPKGPINNIAVLVQIITWHRPGDDQM